MQVADMSGFIQEIVTSGVFLGLIVVLRLLLIRMIRRKAEILSKEQRRWVTRVKNGTLAVTCIGLVMIWAPQLQTFALSLTAFAVALVVATKEMILCLTGSLLRVSTQSYKVGDWIIIDGVMGEVMDIDAFSTRLEEIDQKTCQFTGKSVSIPNSRLFTSQVENRNFSKTYNFQDISITVAYQDMNPVALQEAFQETVMRHINGFQAEGRRFTQRIARKKGIDLTDFTPVFGMRTSDLGHYAFTARVFLPTQESDSILLRITKEFLDLAHNMRHSEHQKKLVA
ncbi:MAG: mechanosensitive ion channel [Micavibrio aeruginosavorus]|nr:mechanosensitive ion channel [Micavibrio aeruginosavorus]